MEIPELHSFVKKTSMSIKQYMDWPIDRRFWLPLSVQANDQLILLNGELGHLGFDPSADDIWSYIWGTTCFSSKKAYSCLRGTFHASPLFKWLWQSRAQNKHKFFFWLLLKDRLNTRNMLRRRNMHLEEYCCVLCVSNAEEDILHLFFECPFSQACWIFLGINWDTSLDHQLMFLRAREDFGSIIFREIVILVMWALWAHRNNIIFDGASLSFASWKRNFLSDLNAVTLRVKPLLKDKINLFVSSLI